ncbi:MAG: ATP-binding cassette domain-containing protein [Opitutales bacterium]|nr:ATP-binding cassette domain-containing protein [Opitutales bacterium]
MSQSPQSSPKASDAFNHVGVEVDHVSIQFGSNKIVTDVTFSVKPGEVFVLMGASGAGKSVLLRAIVGLIEPTSGKVLIDGMDAANPQTHQKIRTALVFQAGALFNSLSVYDNLAFYPREHRLMSEKRIREKVMDTLKILSLEKAAGKHPSELSGGMKKRVAIARALVMEPQLLLYDEPTSELDPIMAATISEIIAALREQYSVTSIVVSHDRELAYSIGGRVAILHQGDLRTVESPSSIQNNQDPVVKEFLNPEINLKNPRFRKIQQS